MHNEKVIYLEAKSWVTTVSYAMHYYGSLRYHNGTYFAFDINRVLTEAQAEDMNKAERLRNEGLNGPNGATPGWRKGDVVSAFLSEESMVREATRMFRKKLIPQGFKILVMGESYVFSPQRILEVVPYLREFKTKLNRLYRRAEKLSWDKKEDEPKLKAIEDDWSMIFNAMLKEANYD